jgi:hypothetical protein
MSDKPDATAAEHALARLKRLGLITVHRRLKRIKTKLGFKVVQDWNAYELHFAWRCRNRPDVGQRPGSAFLRSTCRSCHRAAGRSGLILDRPPPFCEWSGVIPRHSAMEDGES